MAILFKGFKQIQETEGLSFENGYIYFVRTNDEKLDGYIYFNGKKYGTAEDVKKELLGTVEENDAKTFEAVNAAINEIAQTVGDENSGLVEEVNALRAEMNALGSIDGGDGIGGMIDAKIEALKLPETYEQKGAAATAETNAKAYADGLATNYDAAGAAATAETNAKAYTDELANGAVKTNTEAIATLNGTGEGSVSKQVADAIAEVVASAPEDFDTLKEIADYIATDKTGAAELSNTVSSLKTKVGDETTGLVHDVAELQEKAHIHNNKELLDTYTQTESDLADTVSKKHTHENKEVIDGITAEKVTAWDSAETNAKAYADGLATNYDVAGAAATAEQNAKSHADNLNTTMNARVDTLEGVSHEHTNKVELDLIQSGDVEKWNSVYSALTIDGDDVD